MNELNLLRIAVQTYMSARRVLPFLALLLTVLGVVLAGLEPMQVPWLRFALAALLVVAYIATLLHCREGSPKEE